LLDGKKTEINKTIYNILTTHEEFLKITKKLKDVNDFSNTHPWTKNQNISVLDELSLHDAMELFLNKFKYEPRDLENFGSALLLIKHFMNPIKNKNENEEQYDTLGGLILNFHQGFPEVNQEFVIDRYRFTILAVNERQIKLVQLQNIEELTNS
jgi:hypothetical protein